MQQKNEEDDKENRERKIACYFNKWEKLNWYIANYMYIYVYVLNLKESIYFVIEYIFVVEK